MLRHPCLSIALVALVDLVVRAEDPSVSYIFPAGAQRGTVVEVRVGGHFLHEGCPWEMLGPGVKADPELRRVETVWFEGPVIPQPESQKSENYPKDYASRVAVAADAPPGPRAWRVWNSQGVTTSRWFIVGDLPEVIERETEGEPLPVEVQLPVTINGRIFPREDVDVWSFQARRGQTIVARVACNNPVLARGERTGLLDPRLEVRDPQGKPIAEATADATCTAALHFTAAADGEYQVRIHDIEFDGLQHYVYRLTLTTQPHVERTYPLGGRRGERVRFELTGSNLKEPTVEIDLPTDGPAECQHRLVVGETSSEPFLIELDDLPEQRETEPNNVAGSAATVAIPAVVNGRVDPPGDVDFWAVMMKKGEVGDFDLRASRLGSPLDGVLAVIDRQGKELLRADDMPGGQTDCQLRFTAPADGMYLLRVEERLASRGGMEFAYRLRLGTAAAPDFRLTIPVDALTLPRAKPGKLKLTLERTRSFEGPIKLAVDGLPDGVTVTGLDIPAKKPATDLVFTAAESAKIGVSRLTIHATAEIDGRTITRLVAAPSARGQPQVETLLLAVAMPTPFKVVGKFETRFAPRGSVHVRHYSIERGGFEGPLEISLADRQGRHLQGVTGPIITVSPGQSEFDYPIFLPPWMELGRTSRSQVMAVGVVQDADGSRHKVSYTSNNQEDQIIALVGPGLLNLEVEPATLTMMPGATSEVTVHLIRDRSISGTVNLELVLPPHIAGVRATPVTIPSGETIGKLLIDFAEGAGPFNAPLTLRATAHAGGNPHVAEGQLEVLVPRS